MKDRTYHVPESQLALYARGDLGFWSRRAVDRHLERCESCLGIVGEFTALQENLAEAAEQLPLELTARSWNALASEMTANIRLGIAAGECVSTRSRALSFHRPRLAFALAGLAILVGVAVLERPHETKQPVAIESRTTPTGLHTLELDDQGVTITQVYAE